MTKPSYPGWKEIMEDKTLPDKPLTLEYLYEVLNNIFAQDRKRPECSPPILVEQPKRFVTTLTLQEILDSEWYKTRPLIIQQAIANYPPIYNYKMKSGKECIIYSYSEPESGLYEDITVTITKTGIGGGMTAFLDVGQGVFGVKLTDLEKVEI